MEIKRNRIALINKLGIKTPFYAVEKPVVSKAEPWFMLKPEIFKQNPFILKNKILCL